MQWLYLVCFIISIGMMLWLKIYDVKKSVAQFISLLIIAIANLGFLYVSIASNLEEAMFAQKLACAGGVFLPTFYFFMVLEICHIDFNKYLGIILVMIQGMLYACVCTIDCNSLFYERLAIHKINGVVILDTVNGPLHFLFPMMMVIYLVATVAAAVYALNKKKAVNTWGISAMVIFITIGVAAYIFEVVSDMEYEIIPIIYDVLMAGALIPIYDSNLFTVHENTEIINAELEKIGFLTFDLKKVYKGCNSFMMTVFPELSSYRVGQKIESCSDELNEIISRISSIESSFTIDLNTQRIHSNLKSFLLGDRYYGGNIHVIKNTFGKIKGYTIELRDETEHHRTLALQEHYNEELQKEVAAKTDKISNMQHNVILGMAQMVESRDLSTGGHIKRTSDVVRIFANKLVDEDMGLTREFLDLVIRCAPMHDIGKIGVPDAVLQKRGRFTDEEYAAMKKHSEIGAQMLNEILSEVEEKEFVCVAENIAHYHHEKIDGTGYPEGLEGDMIPIEARIMALADVFDALVSKRCYKDAFTYDEAFDIIKHDAGTHFDAKLTKIFMECRPELEKYYNVSV